MHENYNNNKKGLGHTKPKTLYNTHSKYVDIPDNRLYAHYGNSNHFKETYTARIKSNQKNAAYVEKRRIINLVLR